MKNRHCSHDWTVGKGKVGMMSLKITLCIGFNTLTTKQTGQNFDYPLTTIIFNNKFIQSSQKDALSKNFPQTFQVLTKDFGKKVFKSWRLQPKILFLIRIKCLLTTKIYRSIHHQKKQGSTGIIFFSQECGTAISHRLSKTTVNLGSIYKILYWKFHYSHKKIDK